MYNSYSVHIYEVDYLDGKQVKSEVFVNGISIGTIWIPKAETKENFLNLMKLVGGVVYGTEEKEAKKEISNSKLLKVLVAKSETEQKDIQ